MEKEDTPFLILIADDDGPFLNTLVEFLQREGRKIYPAGDGREALEILRTRPIDIVLTDMVMPEVDGLEVLREALRGRPECVVILMTGFGSIDTALRAMREGAFDYKPKPFLLEEMEITFRRAEGYLRLKRELKALRKACASLGAEVVTLREECQRWKDRARVLLQENVRESNKLDNATTIDQTEEVRPVEIASSIYKRFLPGPTMDERILLLLKGLLDQGVLSQKEYSRLKEKVLEVHRTIS